MNALHLYVIGQQVVWCGLVALGLLFLFIGFRLREDRTFAFLGVSIVLLCCMEGVDIWILFSGSPGHVLSQPWKEFFNDLFQALACAYVLATLGFTRALIGRPGPGVLRIHAFAFGALIVGFLIDGLVPVELFMSLRKDIWHTSWAYDWIATPYLVFSFIYCIYLTLRGLLRAQGELRRTLRLILFAYAILLTGGLADILALYVPSFLPNISGTGLGTLAMGVMGTFIFTDKLVLLFEGQRRSLLKIAEIHGTMEAQRPLGDLGRSAAQISEAIRGIVAGMKTDARSLREDPSSGSRSEVARIESARRNLETYTTGILDFSKSGWIGGTMELDPSALAQGCLRNRFSENPDRFRLTGGTKAAIRGNPAKLERALAELLRNALEAEAGTVEIRMREGDGVVSLAIEDNGRGIESGMRGKIAQPFFTTRKWMGACGLGASIAEGIIKAHGGSLRFYPKSGDGGKGLLANVILPKAASAAGSFDRKPDAADGRRRGCLLISDDGACITEFLAICGNVGLRPLVLGSKEGWNDRRDSQAVEFAISDSDPAGEKAAARLSPDTLPCYALRSGYLLPSPGGRSGNGPLVFCEESFLILLSG